MKFRNPETGEVFEDIGDAFGKFCDEQNHCSSRNSKCPMFDMILSSPLSCTDWAHSNPLRAAELMGYEVIDDAKDTNVPTKEEENMENMEKKDKHWLLANDGDGIVCPECGMDFCVLTNDTDYFNYCPYCGEKLAAPIEPRFTNAELEICKAVGAKWVTRDRSLGESKVIRLWIGEPEKNEYGNYPAIPSISIYLGALMAELFPTIKPGECICVEEVQQ